MKYLLSLASGLAFMFCIFTDYVVAEQPNASSPFSTVLMSAAASPTPPAPTTSRHSSDGPEKSSLTVTPDYIMGPEDVLEITVWKNADLSKQVQVRPDGRISLPLIGDVSAVGKTAAQLTEEISIKLKSYMENPTVSILVREVNSYRTAVTSPCNASLAIAAVSLFGDRCSANRGTTAPRCKPTAPPFANLTWVETGMRIRSVPSNCTPMSHVKACISPFLRSRPTVTARA